MQGGALTMSRKKGTNAAGESDRPRPIAIAVRGRVEWKEWAERLRDHASQKLGIPISLNALVGLALAQYAKSIGFKETPPER